MRTRAVRWYASVFALTLILAAAPRLAGQVASVEITDLTDWSATPLQQHNTPEVRHPFTFRALASGSFRPGTVFMVYPGLDTQHAERTADSHTAWFGCVEPGAWQLWVEVIRSDGNGQYDTHELVVPATPPVVEITDVELVPAGRRYRVKSSYSLQAGQIKTGYEYAVYPLLPGGGYGPPVSYPTNEIDGRGGDKVQVLIRTCRGPSGMDEAVLPNHPSVDVAVLSGDGQRAVLREAAEEPLRVKFTSSDPAYDFTTMTAHFQVIAVPSAAEGYGVGATETTASSSYFLPVAADGTASAVMVAGDLPGAYVVRVQSPLSLTGSEAVFTTTGVKPASVAILKDTPDLADLAPAYAVPATEPTTFYSVGLDAAGQKIGPMKTGWITSSSGSPATRGTGTIAPAVAARTATFSPSKAGKLKLVAKTSIKGVSSGAADLFLTSLYVSVGAFDPVNPVDDLPRFVPGSRLDGSSVEPDAMPQSVTLHLLTGESSKGSVTFSLTGVSAYPGIAMNHPIATPQTTPDLAIRDGSGSPVQTATVKFGGTGDTSVQLLVLDYAAHGSLRVTVTSGKTVYTLPAVKMPLDLNGNGIPDSGWKALANSVTGAMNLVSDSYAPTSDGDNDPVVTGLPAQGRTGDGLSVAEEYRGFVVRGKHRRLHPLRKDLFIVIDPRDDLYDDRVTELPLSVHEIRPSEAAGQTAPVVNPNRVSIPGASLQRAILARNRFDPPLYRDLNGIVSSADFQVFGWTFQQGDNVNLIDAATAALALVQSPNETLVAEVYDYAFWRHYVSYGPNGVRETAVAATDVDDPANRAILGGDDWTQSIPNSLDALGDDLQTAVIHTVCGSNPARSWRTLTETEVTDAYKNTFLHEIAHGLNIEHDRLDCSPSIMSDEAAVPVVRTLTPNDHAQIRIHRKHN